VELGERKNGLIKNDIPGNINSTSGNIKTFVAFVMGTITQKSTLFEMKRKLVIVVRT
jgi:hypothetical protein